MQEIGVQIFMGDAATKQFADLRATVMRQTNLQSFVLLQALIDVMRRCK